MKRALAIAVIASAAACAPAPVSPKAEAPVSDTAALVPPAAPRPPDAAPARLDQIPRLRFNQLAAELALPLFWITDEKTPGAIQPEELAVLWGVAPRGAAWVQGGKFTPAFAAAYADMVKVNTEGHPTAGLDEPEKRRRAAVIAELAQGLPTLVRSDFASASAEDKALVGHIIAAAEIIERLYKRQLGSLGIEAEIPAADTASRMLFYRNQGPFCVAPATEKDPNCRGVARPLPRLSGLYPASLLKDPKFCEALEARPDQKELLSPFTVVVEEGGGLKPVPYNVAFKDEMTAVSRELAAAAQAIKSPGEAPFKAYLTAASKSFLDNNWDPADEAWAKMGVENTKWYLRIGPDEVYGDPCNRKAGFHVSFARINQASLAWQRKLEPVKNDMEAELARLAGAPYKARKVSFRLPDFIDVVLNAGDSRDPLGATGGQSLPNWGPVAKDGRGRTVAMVNLYTDDDSQRLYRAKIESLLCKASFDPASLEHDLQIASTVLHEAAHNLGPSHEYQVNKKTDAEIFGGALASIFEELKAQTSSMYLSHWLAGRGLIEKKTVLLEHASDVYWAFGQISQGTYDADGKPKTYPSLASIQIGTLIDAGAMAWKPEEMAANGADKGCFEVRLEKFPEVVTALEKKVLGIKGRGDKAAAAALRQVYVDKDGEWKRLRGVIAERWLRAPRASFVYSIEL
jgi:hypothetical protein